MDDEAICVIGVACGVDLGRSGGCSRGKSRCHFINTRHGETSLPDEQFDPPLFLDTSVDVVVTAIDVLLVTNYLNGPAAGEGEGKSGEVLGEIAAMTSHVPASDRLAAPRTASSASDRRRDQIIAALETAAVPSAEWLLPAADLDSSPAPQSFESWLDDPDPFELESLLEEIAPEIAAGQL